jgi:hypothetical protein
MIITDETLMAYVDDELDAAGRAAVEAAIAQNPEVARRVARQQELRRELRATFDAVLKEPVPDRLLDAARRAPVGAPESVASDLERARAKKAERTARKWSWPEWGAMAASVVLGAFVSQALLGPFSAEPIVTRNGQLVAHDALARALSNQLSAEQPIDTRIAMGLSFRAKDGGFCRTFMIRDGSGLAGLACREGETWLIRTVAPGEKASTPDGGYAMAGADLPLQVLQAVDERIDGEPLDAEGESAARRNHWR